MADKRPREPRRWKLRSELDARFDTGERVERDEYLAWRRETLRDERDDLALRERLLREEAEALRTTAGARDTAALEKLTPADWFARHEASGRGEQPLALAEPKRSASQQRAAELEAEADELAQATVANKTTEEILEDMRAR